MRQALEIPEDLVIRSQMFLSLAKERAKALHSQYMAARVRLEGDLLRYGRSGPLPKLPPRMPPLASYVTTPGVFLYMLRAGVDHMDVDSGILDMLARARRPGFPTDSAPDVAEVRALMAAHPTDTKKSA